MSPERPNSDHRAMAEHAAQYILRLDDELPVYTINDRAQNKVTTQEVIEIQTSPA